MLKKSQRPGSPRKKKGRLRIHDSMNEKKMNIVYLCRAHTEYVISVTKMEEHNWFSLRDVASKANYETVKQLTDAVEQQRESARRHSRP